MRTKEDRPVRENRSQDSIQLYKCRGESVCAGGHGDVSKSREAERGHRAVGAHCFAWAHCERTLPGCDQGVMWNPTPHIFRELGINRKGLERGRDSENPQ